MTLSSRAIRSGYVWIGYIVLMLASCSNPFGNTVKSVVTEAQTPLAACVFRNGYGISRTTAVVFEFSKDMDQASLIPGGSMAGQDLHIQWTGQRLLSISPATEWPDTKDQELSLTCTDLEGFTTTASVILAVLDDDHIYVSPDGAVWNSGRKDEPLDTLGNAILQAREIYPDSPTVEIRVAEGSYITFSEEGQALTLYNGQKMLGGWAPDFSERDPSRYITVLDGQFNEGQDARALQIIDSSLQAVVDGFTIVGPSEGSTVLYLGAASVRISNNILLTYHGTSLYAYNCESDITGNTIKTYDASAGIMVLENGAHTISGNTINSLGSGNKFGIYIYNSSNTVIGNNIVRLNTASGSGTSHTVVLLEYSNVLLYNNILDAGAAYFSTGIENWSSSPLIFNNTIYAGTGSILVHGAEAEAVAIANGNFSGWPVSSPQIINNLILASGESKENHWLIRNLTGNTPELTSANSWSGYTTGLEEVWTGVADSGTNKKHEDIQDYLQVPGWQLVPGADSAVLSGGEDLSEWFDADLAGQTRAAGNWSRGAYQ